MSHDGPNRARCIAWRTDGRRMIAHSNWHRTHVRPPSGVSQNGDMRTGAPAAHMNTFWKAILAALTTNMRRVAFQKRWRQS